MATEAVYSKAIREKATELLAIKDKWAHGVRVEDGVPFVTFASRTVPGRYYHTRNDGQAGCTCPAARKSRSGRCCHQLAIECARRESEHHDALSTWIAEIAAHSTAASADGWETIPESEQASHAAFRARLAAEPTPKRPYHDLFGPDELDGNVSAF